MKCCHKTKSKCNIYGCENLGIKCSKCKYYLCEECFSKWYQQNQSQNKIFSCPHCRFEKTYKWQKNKIFPIILNEPASNENNINTIFNEKETDNKKCNCNCTIYEFNYAFNIFFFIILILIFIFIYLLISYGVCSNENNHLCWYCMIMSIILLILPIITLYWKYKKRKISENILIILSIIESFLIIVLFSKKMVSCLWENEIMFLWMLILCPTLSILNMRYLDSE